MFKTQEDSAGMAIEKRAEYLAFGRPDFTEAEIAAVVAVMRSGWIGQGNETAAFEADLAAATGARHVLTVNSCTSALFLSLLALGVGPGDEVIVPSLTWCSTANAALYLGAKPVFADIDPHTFCITPQSVADKVTARTKAVIPVHMGGLAADIEGMRAVLPDGVAIIEDAAHALGTTDRQGRPIGASGNLVCYSFYANKNLSTAEGGAVATADDVLADKIRSLRLHALPADAWRRFTNPNVTFNGGIDTLGYKMNYTDLQAAIGRAQLARFDEMQAKRLEIAQRYIARLSNQGVAEFQEGLGRPEHAHHLMLVRLSPAALAAAGLTRDALLMRLREANIGASLHYHPLHTMPLYEAMGAHPLPETEALAPLILTLPISASMTPDDADYVCDHLLGLLGVTTQE